MNYQSHSEIHHSYKEMRQTYEEILRNKEAITDFFKDTKEIVFLGSGSSYWMSLSAHRSFNLRTDKKAVAIKAAEVVMAPEAYQKSFDHPVFIAPSRSGNTTELLDALKILKEFYPEAKIFSVTEFLNNQLEEIADLNIRIPWADEISVCQTRSFNCLSIAFTTIVGLLGNEILLNQIDNYLEAAPSFYTSIEQQVKTIVGTMEQPEIVALGSGIQYGITIEGAYIIVEMAEHLANYYQTLEYRHGPIVTANENTFIFICSTTEKNAQYELNIAKDSQAKGAKIIMCGHEKVNKQFDYNFTISGEFAEEIRGLYYVTIMQSVAYHLSVKKGKNPDSPSELVKFIAY